jgi:16S rRNA (adenine1518-N6/adenine1519-N6)-dimethyltransferase
MDRTNFQELKNRLQQSQTWSHKSLGQHFLVNRDVLAKIVQTAAIKPGEQLIEIGPGMGVLTEALLMHTNKLITFEFDPAMVNILRHDFPGLEIVEGDFLQTAGKYLARIDEYKIVANIPYQITTPLLKLLLESDHQPQSMTLLVQKEIGERLTAKEKMPGRSYLSILSQYFAETNYIQTVSKDAFWPPPKVQSAIIQLKILSKRVYQGSDERGFLRFVKMAFNQKRKQLKNVLAGIWGVKSSEIEVLFQKTGLPLKVRAEELSMGNWQQLYNNYKSKI